MEDLTHVPLENLLDKAMETGVIDRWENADDVLVLESSIMRVAMQKQSAKVYVRGLLRGYELALQAQDRREDG